MLDEDCLCDWLCDAGVAVRCKRAMTEADDGFRVDADEFLIGSVLADYVYAHNQRGIVVSLQSLIETFLRYWTLRPVLASLHPWLNVDARSRCAAPFWRSVSGYMDVPTQHHEDTEAARQARNSAEGRP